MTYSLQRYSFHCNSTLIYYMNGSDILLLQEKETIRKIHMPSWLERHAPPDISSLIGKFLPDFLATVPGDLHVIGHCFGGKHALNLAKRGSDVASVVVFHPVSGLTPELYSGWLLMKA